MLGLDVRSRLRGNASRDLRFIINYDCIAVCLSVTASFWFMSEACKGEIMKPRRRPLRCLDSFQNIFGREALRLITRPERSHLARLAERIRERREETWRVLNRDRVAAFIELLTLVWSMKKITSVTLQREELRMNPSHQLC